MVLLFFCYNRSMKNFNQVYANHAELPYFAPQYQEELLKKPVPKRNMVRTAEGLLPGHIIMLWRISFGTYTNQSSHHKYFYTSYGIDAQKELDWLLQENYVRLNTAFESLKHLAMPKLKEFLQLQHVKGLSKMKRRDVEKALAEVYSNEELERLFDLRGYQITDKGKAVLERYPDIVAKHPQKKF